MNSMSPPRPRCSDVQIMYNTSNVYHLQDRILWVEHTWEVTPPGCDLAQNYWILQGTCLCVFCARADQNVCVAVNSFLDLFGMPLNATYG